MPIGELLRTNWNVLPATSAELRPVVKAGAVGTNLALPDLLKRMNVRVEKSMLFNLRLNNALAAVDPASTETASVWARYLRGWTLWNHVRTLASTAPTVLFIVAIAVR